MSLAMNKSKMKHAQANRSKKLTPLSKLNSPMVKLTAQVTSLSLQFVKL